jgi:glycosyltransferase involved in cell wall biosynthesis
MPPHAERRRRVLILPAWYPRLENPVHGIFVRDQARAIGAGQDVAVLFLEPGGPLGPRKLELTDELEDGVRTVRIRVPHGRLRKLRLVAGLFRGLRRLSADGFRADVLHAHVFTLGAVAVVLGRLLGVPVVVSEHYSLFPRRLASRADLALARLAFSGAELTVPVSENLRGAIESYGIRARFRVVPNPVDTTLFGARPAPDAGRTPRLVVVGSLVPIKGLEHLLKALGELAASGRPVDLDVVGDGPERPAHEALAARLGLSDRVVFHGTRPRADVARLMREADLLVQPSSSETLSCVVLEAQVSGLPVVASDVGGIPEVVGRGAGVLVPAGDDAAIAAAIADVLDHPDRFEPAAIAGAARERFGAASIAVRWDELYAEAEALAQHRWRVRRGSPA